MARKGQRDNLLKFKQLQSRISFLSVFYRRDQVGEREKILEELTGTGGHFGDRWKPSVMYSPWNLQE